jgi:hypothetical protein
MQRRTLDCEREEGVVRKITGPICLAGLIAGLACLGPLTAGGAIAQDTKAATPGELPVPDPKLLEQQKAFARELKKEAEARAPKGSPEYYAILRRGLEGYGEYKKSGPSKRLTLDASPVEVTDLDRDESMQRLVEVAVDNMILEPKVYGGLTPPEDDPRYHPIVALVTASGSVRCTGTLIGPRAVLTAAHCVCGGLLNNGSARFGLNANAPGVHIARITGADPYWSRGVGQPFCSGNTQTFAPWPGSDVAVVHIDAAPANVTPASFATAQDPPLTATKDVNFAGFGRDETGQTGVLKQAWLQVVDPFCKKPAHAATYGCRVDAEALIADPVPSQQWACHGDSGGPIMDIRSDIVIVRGVLSRVFGEPCRRPSIHALITPEVALWLDAFR